jgi:hypothetical protein
MGEKKLSNHNCPSNVSVEKMERMERRINMKLVIMFEKSSTIVVAI